MPRAEIDEAPQHRRQSPQPDRKRAGPKKAELLKDFKSPAPQGRRQEYRRLRGVRRPCGIDGLLHITT